ncbi:MAG: hypothetical protein B6I31_01245 [Desulfobacteraceae bacterium 4572_19]|nr:MAG: hypothetical protein B6I31_01245 [Desulfobacteraceae bacterium 4572_19]
MDEIKKILVVDDNKVIRKIIRTELETDNYEVTEAENGIDALLSVVSSPPDLITLDIDMPKLNGFETCKRLHEKKYIEHFKKHKNNHVPIIFVTGNDTIADRMKGFEAGASDFITKPFLSGEILATVKNILEPEKRFTNLTALVVDDSITARNVVITILEREGIKIFEAKNGIEAFEIMCTHMSEIDILITDFMMPEMNGDKLCEKIRKELNLINLPILFLTAVSEQSLLLNIFKAGGTDYIIKPFSKEEFLARLAVHLEHAELHKRLQSTVTQLRGLNEMKDNLLTVCSHDLRTPLNGILGNVELMLEDSNVPDNYYQNLSDIKSSGELLLGLVNDILDLSKVQSEHTELKMKPVSALQLVKTSYNAMKQISAKKQQHFKFVNGFLNQEYSNNKDLNEIISVNESSIIRVINNLLSNAIKFTPINGNITLSLNPVPEDYLTISVSDNGIGIAEKDIPFIFDKFTKTSQSGTSGEEGTGLGMFIVKEIIEKHNGIVKVTSTQHKGSCFEVILPLSLETPSSQENKKTSNYHSITENNKTNDIKKENHYKILIADDNSVNRKVAKKMLEKTGHFITTVRNGQFAVDAAITNSFDLILMDMQMPIMDGLEATKKLRKSGIKIPIIALSANYGQESIDLCYDAGMNDYVSKPFKSAQLNNKINQWGLLKEGEYLNK